MKSEEDSDFETIVSLLLQIKDLDITELNSNTVAIFFLSNKIIRGIVLPTSDL